MTHETNLSTQPINPGSLSKKMLQGAAVAFVLIAAFLLGVKNPDPAWGKFWMIKPLLMVPFAGAMGGAFYHFMGTMRQQGGWIKALGILLGLVGYIVAIWLGSVLGLNGTLWN